MITIKALNTIPCIERKEIKTLYSVGNYDGVLSGVVEYQGKKYYTNCRYSNWYNGERIFFLIDPTPEQLQVLDENHAKWQKIHGNNTDWDPYGRETGSSIRCDETDHHNYFVETGEGDRIVRYELNNRPIVGYFEGWKYSTEEREGTVL